MRKTVSMLLAVVAAAGSISIHEAAAQSRSEKGRSESVTHGGSGREFNPNYRYQRVCMPMDGAGRLYSEDMRGWRRVSSCNGYQLME